MLGSIRLGITKYSTTLVNTPAAQALQPLIENGFELTLHSLPPSHLSGRDAFDEDPEVMAFPMDVAQQQCATAQKRAEEKLAERLEDVDVI